MKEKILDILKKNNDFVNGNRIAEIFGISRMAVSKNIKSLKAEGHEIEAIRNKGYRLISVKDEINIDYIKENVTDFYSGFKYFESIESTNDYLKINSDSESGFVVIADNQSKGRGRYTRSFYSPKNKGIYLSFILKPENKNFNTNKLTPLTAVAVNSAIKDLYPVNSKIKWVNDLVINKKKICGILIEASLEMNTASVEYLIIGIGINVHKQTFPEELEDIATSIENECNVSIDRNELIIKILNNIDIMFNDSDNPDFLNTYVKDSAIIGEKVRYNYSNTTGIATVTSIDSNGSLHLLTDENEEVIMNSGEIKLI